MFKKKKFSKKKLITMSRDILLSVNDESTNGWSGEKAAQYLRGLKGTAVKVKFARSNAPNKFRVS